MHQQSGLSRRRAEANQTENIADASAIVTSGPRSSKQETKDAPLREKRDEKIDTARRRFAFAFVAFAVVLLALSLQKQRNAVVVDLAMSKLSDWKEKLTSISWKREVIPSPSSHPDVRDGENAKPSSTSTDDDAEAEAAAAREELASEARRAAEAAAETSLGASGFVTEQEWEALLARHEKENDDDDATASTARRTKALASVEALIRRRAGAAARGALLADAASLSWQGVPGRAALEAARRCSGEDDGTGFEPEFFVGGGGDDDDEEEEEEEEVNEPPSKPKPKKCPLASSLPRSYPGDVSPSSGGFPFSALGYETLPLLQSLMARNGFDRHHYSQAAASFFSQTRGHVNALARRVTERAIAAANVAGNDGESKAMRSALARAAEDSDASTAVVKVAPLVARFAGTPELKKVVAGALAVHQRSVWKDGERKDNGGASAARAAAGALAAVLERLVVLGESIPEAVASASRSEALSELAKSYLGEASGAFEKDQASWSKENSASLSELLETNAGTGDGGEDSAPAALKGGLAAALMHPLHFAGAVRASMLAGGDAAARAHVVGALLGAATAADDGNATAAAPPPPEWRKKCEKAIQADAMIHLVLHQRGEKVPVAMPGQQVPGAK